MELTLYEINYYYYYVTGADKSDYKCRQIKPEAAGARTIYPRQRYPYVTSNVMSSFRALYSCPNETLITQGYLVAVTQAIFLCNRCACNSQTKTNHTRAIYTVLIIKGTLPRKSTWALNVQFSEKTTMVPFIWM